MDKIFSRFIATCISVVIGLIAAAIIIVVNVFNGVASGWTGTELAWIVAAIIGFIVWEAINMVFLMVGFFKDNASIHIYHGRKARGRYTTF